MSARILIIEDNSANLELMRYLIAAFGHRPIIAREGLQGIVAAEEQLPDLVLCDIQLPDIDGYEVLRRLRAMPGRARLPIVAVTALAMVGDRDKVLAAGFDGYLSKPIDPESFVAQVEAFLPRALREPRPVRVFPQSGSLPERIASGRLILVVDNEASNLEWVAALFESFGYRVVTTSEARQAVALAREHGADLVLSDVCMPNGSGFDLIRDFKADPALGAIPFVFITSTAADPDSRRRGLALGAAKFLFRPIDPPQLVREIEECLGPEAHD